MPSEFRFSVGDLSLRDCCWITQHSSKRFLFIGIVFGFTFLIIWGWEVGTESPIGWEPLSDTWSVIKGIWSEIPIWVKITTISLIALLILHELAGAILSQFGKSLKSLRDWVGKGSFKNRFFILMAIAFFAILFQYGSYLALTLYGMLSFIIWTVLDVFEDLKKEKQRIKDEEKWEKGKEEIEKPRY
jgi:hypothetical protein